MSSKGIEIHGSLSMVLQVSRIAGIAPFVIVSSKNKNIATVSTSPCFYNFTLLLILHIGTVLALIKDWHLNKAHAMRMQSRVLQFSGIMEILLVTLIVTIGVCGAKSRMEQVLDCLNIVEKIKLQTIQKHTSEFKRYFSAIICILICNWNFCIFLYSNINRVDKDVLVISLYVCFFVEYFMMSMIVLQFTFVGITINSGFDGVINNLHDVISLISFNPKPFTIGEQTNIPEALINSTVDVMQYNEVLREDTMNKSIGNSLNRIIVCFGALCDVVRQLDESYSVVLILVIGLDLFYLVSTPCLFFSYLFSDENGTWDMITVGIHFFVVIVYMLLVVEPGQKLGQKMESMQCLVSQMLTRVSTKDVLSQHLDLLYKQIGLNQISYSPLGVFTLMRVLILTIFSIAITFMVVILQYQGIEQKHVVF